MRTLLTGVLTPSNSAPISFSNICGASEQAPGEYHNLMADIDPLPLTRQTSLPIIGRGVQ